MVVVVLYRIPLVGSLPLCPLLLRLLRCDLNTLPMRARGEETTMTPFFAYEAAISVVYLLNVLYRLLWLTLLPVRSGPTSENTPDVE